MAFRGLAGKVVAITGAESGIGRAIALRLAAEGAHVAASGVQTEKLEAVAAEAAGSPGRLIAVPTDVRERAQIDAMYAQTLDAFGRLDAAIANAATFNPSTPLIETDMADWHRLVAVNLTGAFETIQAAAKILLDQGEGGSLLATTSSTVERPPPGTYPYVAGKGGLQLMMRALALEMAPHKIRCNVIMPGFARTGVLDVMSQDYIDAAIGSSPMGALVEPEELAGLVAFAISDEAPRMTGTTLKVDAGRTSA
jgi:NAD(P)-dependent dehydrogenase (short-subunit alcohol dehydrogenase family)